MEAVGQGDSERLAGSGLLALHAELREFLTPGKTQVFLRNIAGHAASLGSRPAAQPAARPAAPRRESGAGGLPALLATRHPDWQLGLLELPGPLAEGALPAGEMDGTIRDLPEKAGDRLERAGREMISGWLKRRTGEVLEIVTGMVASEIGGLLEVARSPGVARLAAGSPGQARFQPTSPPETKSPAWLARMTAGS